MNVLNIYIYILIWKDKAFNVYSKKKLIMFVFNFTAIILNINKIKNDKVYLPHFVVLRQI